MANSKWGTKRMCLSCGKRFYDMRRGPIICPTCDAPFELSSGAAEARPSAAATPYKKAWRKPGRAGR